jgi:hypothetical protein
VALADGDFHPDALAEGRAAIQRKNECISAAIKKLLEGLESVLGGHRSLEREFVYRVTLDGCEIFTQGFCTLTCNEGVAVAVGRKEGRRVVLAILTFDDVSWAVTTEDAERAAGRNSVARIKDV